MSKALGTILLSGSFPVTGASAMWADHELIIVRCTAIWADRHREELDILT